MVAKAGKQCQISKRGQVQEEFFVLHTKQDLSMLEKKIIYTLIRKQEFNLSGVKQLY